MDKPLFERVLGELAAGESLYPPAVDDVESLSEAQRDGRACVGCAGDSGPMAPAGWVEGGQVFAHPGCFRRPAVSVPDVDGVVRAFQRTARAAALFQATAELAAGMRASATFTVLAAVQRDGLRSVAETWDAVRVAAADSLGGDAASAVERILAELGMVRVG